MSSFKDIINPKLTIFHAVTKHRKIEQGVLWEASSGGSLWKWQTWPETLSLHLELRSREKIKQVSQAWTQRNPGAVHGTRLRTVIHGDASCSFRTLTMWFFPSQEVSLVLVTYTHFLTEPSPEPPWKWLPKLNMVVRTYRPHWNADCLAPTQTFWFSK